MNRGKQVIIAMVLAGVALSSFAWYTRYRASQEVLDRFGAKVSIAVRKGEKVELLTLSEWSEEEATENEAPKRGFLVFGDHTLSIDKSLDISEAAGLIHARHHLLHRKGFNWDEATSKTGANWPTALRFTHNGESATWVLDFEHRQAYLFERELEVNMSPISEALRRFLDSVVPAEPGSDV